LTDNAKREARISGAADAKPFLQWVGGKRDLLSQCGDFFPKQYKNYYEPFLGGGAVFFHLKPQKAILSDSNAELIRAYEGVRDEPEMVIDILNILKSKHSEDLYMRIRLVDRELDILKDLSAAEVAARMVYLNQTGFNGLYRVNRRGEFNVPIGSSLNRLICDEDGIRTASNALRKVTIAKSDFEEAVSSAGKGDLVYMDPPYHPVSEYSDFTRYTKEKFYEEDQVRLRDLAADLADRGCKVMLSNSDCPLIRNVYRGFRVHKVKANRLLNSRAEKRGQVSELLITNF